MQSVGYRQARNQEFAKILSGSKKMYPACSVLSILMHLKSIKKESVGKALRATFSIRFGKIIFLTPFQYNFVRFRTI